MARSKKAQYAGDSNVLFLRRRGVTIPCSLLYEYPVIIMLFVLAESKNGAKRLAQEFAQSEFQDFSITKTIMTIATKV